jgi:hypothetical protein
MNNSDTRKGNRGVSRSTNAMSRPVRPPTRPKAPVMFLAAPATAGPAAEVTRERPFCAFVAYSDAVADAFDALCLAASAALPVVVVDSKRRAASLRASPRVDRLADMESGILY